MHFFFALHPSFFSHIFALNAEEYLIVFLYDNVFKVILRKTYSWVLFHSVLFHSTVQFIDLYSIHAFHYILSHSSLFYFISFYFIPPNSNLSTQFKSITYNYILFPCILSHSITSLLHLTSAHSLLLSLFYFIQS